MPVSFPVHNFCCLSSLTLPKAASAHVSPMPFQLLPPIVSLLYRHLVFIPSSFSILGNPCGPSTTFSNLGAETVKSTIGDMVFDSTWPHFCFGCVIPYLHSFSTPYFHLHCLPPIFPPALHVPLHNYSVSSDRGKGCFWDAGPGDGLHLEGHSEKRLEAVADAGFSMEFLWWAWSIQLAEGCGGKAKMWVYFVTHLTKGCVDTAAALQRFKSFSVCVP